MTKTLLLILILLLAFFMAFIPHIGYDYPLHVDEWSQFTYCRVAAETGHIAFEDPFISEYGGGRMPNAWPGYQALIAALQLVSGIDWLVLFRYGPSVIFMFTVLSVYVFARRRGYGLEAAFFTLLIPTTVGLVGPAFMVPMALCLPLIMLLMYLAFYIRTNMALVAILLLYTAILTIHAPSSVLVLILITPYLAMNLKGNVTYALCLLFVLLAPLAILAPVFFNLIQYQATHLAGPGGIPAYLELPPMFFLYGVIPIILAFIGSIFMAKQGGKANYGLLAGLALLLVIMLLVIRTGYGSSIIYERGMTVVFLLLSVCAGSGLYHVAHLDFSVILPSGIKTTARNYSIIAVYFFASVAIVSIAIPVRLNQTYYHLIDGEDYRAFTWMRDNLGPEYEAALVDPWKATPFTALAGKRVVYRIVAQTDAREEMINRFYANAGRDTSFLLTNSIPVIYSRQVLANPELLQVRKNVYILASGINTDNTVGMQLKNGGFESIQGTPPAAWRKYFSNCNPEFIFPVEGRNGGYGAGIKVDEPVKPVPTTRAYWLQDIPVKEGTTYMMGGWLKTDNISGAGGARIAVQWKGPGNTWIGETKFMEYLKGTNGWTFVQGKVKPLSGATVCTLLCMTSECNGTVWFDDIFFRQE